MLLVVPLTAGAEQAGEAPAASDLPALYRQDAPTGGTWDALRREGRRLLQPAALLEFLDQVDDGGVQGTSRILGAQAFDVLQALLATSLDSLEQDEPMVRNLDFSFQPGLRAGAAHETLSADLLLSLSEHGRGTLFSQGGLQLHDGRPALNLGLGYRWLLAEHWLLGSNVFYDRLAEAGLERYSLGLELKSRWLDLYGNIYRGLRPGGRQIASFNSDGWDVELAGRVPRLPWIEVLGKYYFWDAAGDGAGLSGQEYGLRVRPMSFAGVELHYDTPQSGVATFGLEANLVYRFGVPLADQFQLRGYTGPSSLQRRFERVRRQYESLPQAVPPAGKNGASGARATVRGRVYLDGAALAGLPLGSPVPRPLPGAAAGPVVTVHLQGVAADDAQGVHLELVGNAVLGVDYHPVAFAAAQGQVGATFTGTTARVAPAPGEVVALRFQVLPGNGVPRQLQLRVQGHELALFEIHPAPHP